MLQEEARRAYLENHTVKIVPRSARDTGKRKASADPVDADELAQRKKNAEEDLVGLEERMREEANAVKPASDAMRRLWHGMILPGDGHNMDARELNERARSMQVPANNHDLARVVAERQIRHPEVVKLREEWKMAARAVTRKELVAMQQAKKDARNEQNRQSRTKNGHAKITNKHIKGWV